MAEALTQTGQVTLIACLDLDASIDTGELTYSSASLVITLQPSHQAVHLQLEKLLQWVSTAERQHWLVSNPTKTR